MQQYRLRHLIVHIAIATSATHAKPYCVWTEPATLSYIIILGLVPTITSERVVKLSKV